MRLRASTWSSAGGDRRHSRSSGCADRDSSSRSTAVSSRSPSRRWGSWSSVELGLNAEDLAAEIHRIAGGWPAAVTLAIEALKSSPRETWSRVFAGLDKPDAPLFSYLAEEVFARHPDAVRDLVSKLALFERFTPELCEAIGLAGSRSILAELTRQGLFVEQGQDGSLALRPLIRDYALESLPVHRGGRAGSPRDSRRVARRHRRCRATRCRCCSRQAPPTSSPRSSTTDGSTAARGRPDRHRAARVPRHPARAADRRDRATGGRGAADPGRLERGDGLLSARGRRSGVAARPSSRGGSALIHYLRGEPEAALAVYQRGVDDTRRRSRGDGAPPRVDVDGTLDPRRRRAVPRAGDPSAGRGERMR